MADDTADATTSTADVDTTTTDATAAATTDAEPEDLTGLKAALATEREERKRLAKEAKTNASAAAELAKVKAAAMTDQEKAVAAAKAEGLAEAAKTYGTKLAAAEFRAAVAAAGLDLGEASDLIDVGRFVGDDGEVDEKAIKAAVAKLAKVTSKAPSRSGGDGPPGGSTAKSTPTTLDEAVAARYA